MFGHYKHRWRRLQSTFIRFLFVHLVYRVIRPLAMWTLRIEVIGKENLVRTASQGPCVLMLWHNRLLLSLYCMQVHGPNFKYAAVISNSRDGALLTGVLDKLRPMMRAIRVPAAARHRALKEMVAVLKEDQRILVVTPDGPRGPCYKTKPGAVAAAEMTKAKIIPMSWSCSHYWQLKSWDGLMIPKPFSKVRIMYGAPILVAGEEGSLEDKCRRVDQALHALQPSP